MIRSKSSNDVQRLKGTSILDSGGNLLVKEILEKQNLLQLKQKLQNYRCAFKSLSLHKILQLTSSFIVSTYVLDQKKTNIEELHIKENYFCVCF